MLCGISTDHCVATAARIGANLGYDNRFVLDATHTFDRTGTDGRTLTADELAQATATSLHGEFAQVVLSDSELTEIDGRGTYIAARTPALRSRSGHRGSARYNA